MLETKRFMWLIQIRKTPQNGDFTKKPAKYLDGGFRALPKEPEKFQRFSFDAHSNIYSNFPKKQQFHRKMASSAELYDNSHNPSRVKKNNTIIMTLLV